MSGCVFYICGGRSFSSNRPRRKMADIIKCWRGLGYGVEHICGGDFFVASGSFAEDVESTTQYYRKWYRKLFFMSPFVHSCSERRDIRNDVLMYNKLTNLVKQKRPDIIWERSNRLCGAGLKVAQQLHIPYVLEWKDNIIKYKLSLYHHRAVGLEKCKNSESDCIVVESNKIKEDLTAEGINADKILVAHNAANPQEFCVDSNARQEYRCKLGIKEDEVLIGYVGGYSWYHDMIRLVLAAEILRKQKQSSIKILMVGTGKDYDKVLELAKELNLFGSMIIMEPWVPAGTVPKVLSALDIAVLPGSTDIICPIKVQEYMAMELPAVVPDYDCNREVITDGQTGMLFEPRNEQALAEVLLKLAEDKELRAEIGKQARQEVLNRFTWEKTWGKTLQEIMHRVNAS